MKEYVSKRSRSQTSPNDIIRIAGMAKADKDSGNEVINASIGAFLDEEKKLGTIRIINETLKEHITDNLAYPSSLGNREYQEAVMDFVFAEKRKTIEENNQVFFGATLGGTGAISICFNLFVEENRRVILPNVMWTNYTLIASKAHIGYRTYTLLTEDGHFNIQSLKETIEEEIADCGRALVVINDPCQNPTGYCLEKAEYDSLFQMLNEESRKGYLSVIFDIAYFSFYPPSKGEFPLFGKLCENNTFLPLVVFSCSKVFSMYGLRCGALIALCPDETNRKEIHEAFLAQARGVYSVPVGSVLYAVSFALNDPSKKDELAEEIKETSSLLEKRSSVMISLLDQVQIRHYPYVGGFFITLITKNAFSLFERLKKKHIYTVPMDDNHLRLALSGLSIPDVNALVQELKKEIIEND